MEPRQPSLDVSSLDPVDVVVVLARKAGLAVPEGAQDWLAAPAPPPPAEVERYATFLAQVRAAELPDVLRGILDGALDGATGPDRLADLLGQATAPAAPVPPPDDDRAGPPDAGDDEQGWYEAPPDDAVAVLLAAARRAGVPVPAGGHAWLSTPGIASFERSWPYRRMLTSLALAPLPPEVRAEIDDAISRSRATGTRLAHLLEPEPRRDPDPPREPASAGLGDLYRRAPATTRAGRSQRAAPGLRVVLLVVLSLAGGVLVAWGLQHAVPAVRERLISPATDDASPRPDADEIRTAASGETGSPPVPPRS